MGAPVFSTSFVGQCSQADKRVMTCAPTAYSWYKSIEGQAKQAYEIGASLHSAYKIGRPAYPYLRAGIQAAMA